MAVFLPPFCELTLTQFEIIVKMKPFHGAGTDFLSKLTVLCFSKNHYINIPYPIRGPNVDRKPDRTLICPDLQGELGLRLIN